MFSAKLIRLSTLLEEVLDLDAAGRDGVVVGLQGDDALLLPTLRRILAAEPTKTTPTSLARPFVHRRRPKPRPRRSSAPANTLALSTRACDRPGRHGRGLAGGARMGSRQVALKLPMLSARRAVLVQRFARERDILGSLAHPHIARLYDAGLAGDGQPYLALEYVEGSPITAYCEEGALSPRARVQLLQQVLQAVQYAHANLVIHRDLKPSNVLVTAQGHDAVDFGIAVAQEDRPKRPRPS